MSRSEARPERREFVADGHDVADSIQVDRWRTPSGEVLVEGQSYIKEWRGIYRVVRIEADGTEVYKWRGAWVVVSEALRRGEATNREAQAPLPASVSATPEGSQRGQNAR